MAAAFFYAMLIQLIISFVFLSYVHMNIDKMLTAAIIVTVIAAVVWPVIRIIKYNKERKKEEELAEWHKQR